MAQGGCREVCCLCCHTPLIFYVPSKWDIKSPMKDLPKPASENTIIKSSRSLPQAECESRHACMQTTCLDGLIHAVGLCPGYLHGDHDPDEIRYLLSELMTCPIYVPRDSPTSGDVIGAMWLCLQHLSLLVNQQPRFRPCPLMHMP